jgi:hypothetical protein
VVLAIGGVGFYVFRKSTTTKSATTNVTSLAPAPVQPPNAPEVQYPNMKLYSNQKDGISFYYLEEWKVEERDPATSSVDSENTELVLPREPWQDICAE